MSESTTPLHRRGSLIGPWERRGPIAADPSPTSPSSGEHLAELTAAEADAAYRWAATMLVGRTVLDLGCGDGSGAARLLDAGADSVIGVDEDAETIESATKIHGERARFLTALPVATGLAAASFEAICCFTAIESAPDPEAILAELARLLAPGGLLLLSLPTGPLLDPIAGRELRPAIDRTGWSERIGRLPGFDTEADSIAFYRRRSSLAATVIPDDADPAEMPASWLGGDRDLERAVLMLAAAAGGAVPNPPALATLVGGRDIRAYRDTIAAWEQRARRAEAEGAAKHWELVASREAQRRLRKRLWELEHTTLRKLVRVLRGRPAKLSEGPPIRPPELDPEPWD